MEEYFQFICRLMLVHRKAGVYMDISNYKALVMYWGRPASI